MAHRRPLLRTPLLVGGGLVSLSACAPEPTIVGLEPVGNLMPPPTAAQVCVEREPATATLTVGEVTTAEPCVQVSGYLGQVVSIDVSAPGYVTARIAVAIDDVVPPQEVTLGPVGNPMPPPTEVPPDPVVPAPVGNLMLPPQPVTPKP